MLLPFQVNMLSWQQNSLPPLCFLLFSAHSSFFELASAPQVQKLPLCIKNILTSEASALSSKAPLWLYWAIAQLCCNSATSVLLFWEISRVPQTSEAEMTFISNLAITMRLQCHSCICLNKRIWMRSLRSNCWTAMTSSFPQKSESTTTWMLYWYLV